MKNIAYIDGQNFMHRVAEVLTEANLISDKQEIFAVDIDSYARVLKN
ncbi:hypothetical protein IJ095_01540 [Candidatus Saccharibacteria bacterium]|nr:hypothetical protein [Candidatus Saccharibacteria bacterium]